MLHGPPAAGGPRVLSELGDGLGLVPQALGLGLVEVEDLVACDVVGPAGDHR